MAEAATVGRLCLITEEAMIACDAVFIIECGHPSGIDGIDGAVVLSCTLNPGHAGGLHHDIEGLWWREDG